MNMKKHFTGRAEIIIEGENIERFLAQLQNEFALYDIIRQDDRKIFLSTDFANLSNIFAKNCNKCYNITVVKTYGFLPMLHNIKSRWVLAVGILLLVVVPIVLSMFLWEVKIYSSNEGDIESVQAQIDKLGLLSKPKSLIDKKSIEDYLYLSVDNLTFVNCRVEGVRLKISVAFEIPPTTLPQTRDNIVAKKSGTVQKIIVYSGTAVVKIGDKVNAGDTLIAGDIDGQKVAAVGDVYVSNIVDYEHTVPKQKIEYVRSGNYVDKTHINMLLFESNINKDIPFAKYETQEFWYYPFYNNLLPIKIHTLRYYELVCKIVDSDFENKKNLYLQIAMVHAFQDVVGEYEIVNQLVETEDMIDCDTIRVFCEYIQNAC